MCALFCADKINLAERIKNDLCHFQIVKINNWLQITTLHMLSASMRNESCRMHAKHTINAKVIHESARHFQEGVISISICDCKGCWVNWIVILSFQCCSRLSSPDQLWRNKDFSILVLSREVRQWKCFVVTKIKKAKSTLIDRVHLMHWISCLLNYIPLVSIRNLIFHLFIYFFTKSGRCH